MAAARMAQIQDQLKKGGLILWVSVETPDAEKRAIATLEKIGAQDVHVHTIKRERIPSDLPRTLIEADPFLLESDRY